MADPAAALAPGLLALPNAPFGVATPQEQGETAPTGLDKIIADFINGAAKLSMIPGQALQSQQPISTEEMVKPATDLAIMTTLGAGAMPAEANVLRSGMGAIQSQAVKPNARMIEAYQLGQKMAQAKESWRRTTSPTGDFYYDAAYGHLPNLTEAEVEKAGLLEGGDPVLAGFYQSGFHGLEPPTFTRGSRFGNAPQAGQSFNTREEKYERGVSMASADHPDFKNYEWFDVAGNRQRSVQNYQGWLLPFRGGDNEPLMVGLEPIR